MAKLIYIFILLFPYLCLGVVFKILQYHYTDGKTWGNALWAAFDKFIFPAWAIIYPALGFLLVLGILYFFYTIFENAFF